MRALLMAGIVAGVLAGLLVTALQLVEVVPLIHAAEHFEAGGAPGAGHHHEHDGADGLARHLGTLGANLLTGIGFGLLLVAGLALTGGAGWRTGLWWGLAGFVAFFLAPAQGLPPELPGAAVAELTLRQAWWIGTAAATAGGLALLFLGRRLPLALAGVALLLLPHLIGAPQPAEHGGTAPAATAHAFLGATLVANALFWAALGLAAGLLYRRFAAA